MTLKRTEHAPPALHDCSHNSETRSGCLMPCLQNMLTGPLVQRFMVAADLNAVVLCAELGSIAGPAKWQQLEQGCPMLLHILSQAPISSRLLILQPYAPSCALSSVILSSICVTFSLPCQCRFTSQAPAHDLGSPCCQGQKAQTHVDWRLPLLP